MKNYLGSLEDLQRAEDRLDEEVGNLHHELRRVRDGLERVGGTSQALEQRARQLMSSIELCQRDLKMNRKTQEKISLQMRSSRDDDNDSLETGSES